MFYSTQILGKKGPLATIWLAAHMERKLKKEQWLNTSVADSVDTIITPEGPLALRLVGQLLLGVVRIHSLKINHLLGDCTQAVQRLDKAGPQLDQTLVRVVDQNLTALPKDLDEIEFFQQAARDLELQGFDASMPFSTDADDNGLIFLTDDALDGFHTGTQDEMFDPVRDEEMEQLLLSPEKLRDAGRSPSLRRAFEELRAASVGSKTPTQSGRRANSQSSQGQEEDQRQVPQDEDMLNVPQPSPAPLMQDVPDFDMPEAPPLGDDLLGDNLEGLDAMLPTPTPSGKSQSRSAGKSRGGTTPRSKAGSQIKQAAERADPSQSSPGPSGAPDLSQPEPPQTQAGVLRHAAKPPRARRARAQVDKDVRVQSRAGQGTADLVRPPTRLTRAALLGQAPGMAGGEGLQLQHLAVSDVMAPALLALYNRACCQARATPRKRAPAGTSEAQPTPWSVVEQRAQQQDLPEPDTQGHDSMDAGPMQDDYAPPDTWEADLGTGEMPPDPFAASQAQQLASPQQAPEASGQDPLSQQLSARRSQSTRSRLSLGSPGSLGPIASSEEQSAADRGSMTARSRKVLTHLEALFRSESSKRRRTQSGALRQPGTALLNPVVEGKTTVDASRWFFELLVLKSQGHVGLQQEEAYGDVTISAAPSSTPSTAAL